MKITIHPETDADLESAAAPGASCQHWSVSSNGLSRRQLILSSVGVVASALLSPIAVEGGSPANISDEMNHLGIFSEHQRATIKAAMNRLIPEDELGPGAGDAGGVAYIDHLVRNSYTNNFKGPNNPWKVVSTSYLDGLTALDEYAIAVHSLPFVSLSDAIQDQILKMMETTENEIFPDAKRLFGLLHQHAIESMFGDPAYGGNIQFAGWKLLKFPGVQLSFSEKHADIDATVELTSHSFLDFGFFDDGGI